jgi:protein tyrosine/serine phosphatase
LLGILGRVGAVSGQLNGHRWIGLEGAANVRDLGGLPTVDGALTRSDRLIRSDNLQGLTAADVRLLVEVHGVRAVADLRTRVEVDAEGPGPLTRQAAVRIGHFSLFPEAGHNTDAAALDESKSAVLPWQDRKNPASNRRGAAEVYFGYLTDRADAAVESLRFIARAEGAAIVHCAAGKDRTGVISALALAEVGVHREAIIEDYALSAERIEAIFARLLESTTYAGDLPPESIDKHRPRADTMARLLDALDDAFGGPRQWLRRHGWSETDAERLRAHLLD